MATGVRFAGILMMNKTKSHLLISFVTQYAELIIQFIGVLMLSRILSPGETGTYSVAAFLMTLLHVFRDFGVVRYLIQEQELTAEKIRSAFGVAIILAWAVALILLISSNLIANLYRTPEIREILVVMSASFAATPLGSLLTALFRREMQFQKILITKISSAVCQVSISVLLAYKGYGAISLAWGNFAGILAFGIVATLMRSPTTPWLPRFTNVREILSFGGISSLGTLANVAGTNAPDVILGKVIDLAAAGYFSRANGLIQLFKTLVTGTAMPLILPYFAQLRRESGDFLTPYRLAVSNLTAMAWPFFAVMALLAFPVVRTLYGDQWDVSVPLVRILCVAGAISALSTFAGEVMIANGGVRSMTVGFVISSAVRIIAILSASLNGLPAVAVAVVISEGISLVVTSHFLHKATGIKLTDVMRDTRKSAVVTGCSIVIPAIVTISTIDSSASHWLTMICGLAGAFAGWVIGLAWTNHPMKQHVYQVYGYLIKIRWGQSIRDS